MLNLTDNYGQLNPEFFPPEDSRCFDEHNDIFIQIACVNTNQFEKYNKLLFVSCISGFISVVFSLTMY